MRGFTSASIGLILAILGAAPSPAAEPLECGGFEFSFEATLPGTPEAVYDAMTGDISGWWDHTFSASPKELSIDPHPGGAFREVFNGDGDGALHATVILAERGKLLRMDGPLGLSGHALTLVVTWEYEPVGTKATRLVVTARAAGEMQDGWAEGVEAVWRHFIFERLAPYLDGRK